MYLKLFFFICFFIKNETTSFFEKLTNQSQFKNAMLSATFIFPLVHAMHLQYHIRNQHQHENECPIYSRHYLQDIPFLNILFYLNIPISVIMEKYYNKKHNEICFLYKTQINTRHHRKKCDRNCNKNHSHCFNNLCNNSHYYVDVNNNKCPTRKLFHIIGCMDFFSSLFFIGKLIHIAYQS